MLRRTNTVLQIEQVLFQGRGEGLAEMSAFSALRSMRRADEGEDEPPDAFDQRMGALEPDAHLKRLVNPPFLHRYFLSA